MEAVVDIDPRLFDSQIERPKSPVTELKVLQPRQTSSLERRLKTKHHNVENGQQDRPISCEVVNWSLTGNGADLLRVLQVSKSPRGSLKRNETTTKESKEEDVDEDFLKSPHRLRNLSVGEISQCLKAIGLESYVGKFRDENIDGKQFVDLDDDILTELDVDKKIDKEKIMQLVQEGVIRPKKSPTNKNNN